METNFCNIRIWRWASTREIIRFWVLQTLDDMLTGFRSSSSGMQTDGTIWKFYKNVSTLFVSQFALLKGCGEILTGVHMMNVMIKNSLYRASWSLCACLSVCQSQNLAFCDFLRVFAAVERFFAVSLCFLFRGFLGVFVGFLKFSRICTGFRGFSEVLGGFWDF